MGSRRRIATSIAAQLCNLVFALGTAVITARWLGPEGRGVLSFLTSGAFLGSVALGLGLSAGISTGLAQERLSAKHAALAAVVVAGVSVLAAQVLAHFMSPLAPAPFAVAFAVLPYAVGTIVLSQAQTAAAAGCGRLSTAFLNAATTGATHIAVFAILALHRPPSVAAAAITWVVGQGAGALVGWVSLMSGDRNPPTVGLRTIQWLARFSAAAFPGLLVASMNVRADAFLLGFLSSPKEVGLYSIAVVSMSVLTIVPSGIGQGLMRSFGGESGSATQLTRGMVAALVSGGVLGALAIPAAAILLPAVFGVSYRGASPMIGALIPGFVLFSPCYVSSGYANVVIGKPGLNARVALVALLTDLVGLILLAPRLGGLGAAVASSVGYSVGAAYNLWALRRAGVDLRLASARDTASGATLVVSDADSA